MKVITLVENTTLSDSYGKKHGLFLYQINLYIKK